MREPRVIVDTGPLVALLVRDDFHHRWVVEHMRELPPPFLTCEPVLTETFHLVSKLPQGVERFFDLLDTGLLLNGIDTLAERSSLAALVRRYANLPISLADACLVRLAEINPSAVVFTLDGHFRVCRRNRRQLIPVLMP